MASAFLESCHLQEAILICVDSIYIHAYRTYIPYVHTNRHDRMTTYGNINMEKSPKPFRTDGNPDRWYNLLNIYSVRNEKSAVMMK